MGGRRRRGEKYNDNKPYLYQARAAFTEGLTPTMIEYLKLKRPDAKRVSDLAYDIAGVAYADAQRHQGVVQGRRLHDR